MLSIEALTEALGAEQVAGDYIATVDGKRVLLARRNAGGYTFTDAGLALANSLHPLDRDADGGKGGSRPRKTKVKDEPTSVEQTHADATKAPENPPVGDGVEHAPELAAVDAALDNALFLDVSDLIQADSQIL